MFKRTMITICLLLTGWSPVNGLLQANEDPIRYRVRIAGIEDRTLRRELRNISVMYALADNPPISDVQLRRRARRDPPLFEQVLRNHGFFQPTVETDIALDRRRPRVRFELDTGPTYHLREVRLVSTDTDVFMPPPQDIGLPAGNVALASTILQGNENIIRLLRTRGYAHAKIVSREVIVVHPENAVDVHFEVDPGNKYRFGPTTIHGLQRVREPFVRGKLPWVEGDLFDGREFSLARRRLVSADLFGAVRVETLAPNEDDNLLPISIELSERKHRSISLGVGYSSDEGWRTGATWTHRNLLRRGERLSIDYAISERGHGGELAFMRPDYRRADQNLHLLLQREVEDTPAFRSDKIGALARVTRLHRDTNLYGVGMGLRYASVEESGDRQAYNLLYIPTTYERDRSNDLLDPRRGYRLNLGFAPYWDTIDTTTFFIKPRASIARYYNISRSNELDWAVRLTMGSILGESRKRIPADERYYAGGGGSIRGYRYQLVGPLDNGKPTGGRSLFLFSQELRWRWSETMGLVAFLDGGAVTEEALFEKTVDEFRWGTGLGFRYFTPLGPVRLDAAVPVRRRQGIDDPWQFYISLGQAF